MSSLEFILYNKELCTHVCVYVCIHNHVYMHALFCFFKKRTLNVLRANVSNEKTEQNGKMFYSVENFDN